VTLTFTVINFLDKRSNVQMTEVYEHEVKRLVTYCTVIHVFQNPPGGTRLMSSKINCLQARFSRGVNAEDVQTTPTTRT
jgi:hypothetical protein